jgi:hypothetical protein
VERKDKRQIHTKSLFFSDHIGLNGLTYNQHIGLHIVNPVWYMLFFLLGHIPGFSQPKKIKPGTNNIVIYNLIKA